MDRFNFYFEQLVGEADMDEVFDFAENADHALMTDNGYTGIVSGLGVTENTVPDLNVIVAIGTAYDQTGQRIRIGAPQTLDMSVDSNSVSTTVAVNGNEKWLSIFAQFTRALSDPRIDGNGVTVQYREAESFTLIKEQGAEAAPGTAASLLAANSETYALTDGNTLTLQVNGGAVQTVTFNTGDFAAIGAATAAEVASVIDTQTTGVNASDSGGAVLIETLTANAIAKLQVTGGTDAAAFAFPGSIASGAGGPTPPALKGDALLLADVLIRRDGGGTTTTQIFNAPDAGGAAGYIEGSRREVTFIFNGTTFEIREGTITGFATQLAQDLQNHISNTGNAHPSTAITFDGTGSSGPDLPPLGATATVDSALDELDLRKASLGNPNTFTGSSNTFANTTTYNGTEHNINSASYRYRDPAHAFTYNGLVPPFRTQSESIQIASGHGVGTSNIVTLAVPLLGVDESIIIEGSYLAFDDNVQDKFLACRFFIAATYNSGTTTWNFNSAFSEVSGGSGPAPADTTFLTGTTSPSDISAVPDAFQSGVNLILRQPWAADTVDTNFVVTWTTIRVDLNQ